MARQKVIIKSYPHQIEVKTKNGAVAWLEQERKYWRNKLSDKKFFLRNVASHNQGWKQIGENSAVKRKEDIVKMKQGIITNIRQIAFIEKQIPIAKRNKANRGRKK